MSWFRRPTRKEVRPNALRYNEETKRTTFWKFKELVEAKFKGWDIVNDEMHSWFASHGWSLKDFKQRSEYEEWKARKPKVEAQQANKEGERQ